MARSQVSKLNSCINKSVTALTVVGSFNTRSKILDNIYQLARQHGCHVVSGFEFENGTESAPTITIRNPTRDLMVALVNKSAPPQGWFDVSYEDAVAA